MRRFIKYLFFYLLSTAPVAIFAQQDPLFTQYLNNPLSINPAYAGSRGTLNLMTLHRRQWTGFNGAPVTSTISLNQVTKNKKVGLGFSFLNDNIGPIAQNGLYADYAYHLQFTRYVKLSFGLKGGFNHYRFNLNTLAANDTDDSKILNGDKTMFLPNVGFGMYLYSEKFVVGFSIPKLLQNSFTGENNTLEYLSKEERHYFLMAGVLFNLSEGIRFRPSLISRIVQNSPLSLDVNAQFIFADKFWVGAVYRLNGSLGGSAQFQINKKMRIGYAYDVSSSWLRAYNSGTHEIFLNFDFNLSNGSKLGMKYF